MTRPSFPDGFIAFIDNCCRHCTEDKFDQDTCEGGCQILNRSLVYGEAEPEYPTEMQTDADGNTDCTAFNAGGCPLRCEPTPTRTTA